MGEVFWTSMDVTTGKKMKRESMAEKIIQQYADQGNNAGMYGDEFEAHLRNMEANEMGYLANVLRRMRDEIARNTNARAYQHQCKLQAEQTTKDCELPPLVRQAIILGHDEHGVILSEHGILAKLQASVKQNRLIFLWGPCGTGKTFAACQWLFDRGHGLYVTGTKLMALNRNWSSDGAELARYENTSALVIDDIGRGLQDAKEKARLEDFLCDRHANNFITVCTTNLMPKEVIAEYGERVASRLKDVGCSIKCEEVLRHNNGPKKSN